MKNTIITISESGRVMIPDKISMRAFEVAELFGVYVQTINANVRAIVKSGAVHPDISGTVTKSGGMVIPLDLGLDMITALAFRLNSPQAKYFRRWVLDKLSTKSKRHSTAVVIRLQHDTLPT